MISFPAVIYGIRTDKDGESRITLDVPRSSLKEMGELAATTGTLIHVVVATQGEVKEK